MSVKTPIRSKAAVNHDRKVVFGEKGRLTATIETMPAELLDVGVMYMQELKDKALKVSQALQKAGVPHAVIGGLALASYLARAHKRAERNTQDVDILLHRKDLEAATRALKPLGYRYRKVMKLHAFMPNQRGAHFVDGIHIIWSEEKVRDEYLHPTPALIEKSDVDSHQGIQYLSLYNLVVMKLTSFRHKDITHIQDLIYWKLLTKKIEAALPADLKERLEQVKRDTKRESL